jgi:AAA+ ATPase superfamily predicted ATPase
VPKYIDLLISNHAFSTDEIINFYLSSGSPIVSEGRNILIEEFGKEYGFYFSILELISAGKTSRVEIESVLQTPIGGYLERLDSDYSVIRKYKPINAKPNAKLQKYHLQDHFLRFWFRFIYKNRTAVETENFSYIKNILARDLDTYRGKLLESFYYDLFAATHQFNLIGSYWERDGRNEIDLIAVNDMQKRVVIAEIKLNKNKINLDVLRHKAEKLVNASYSHYEVTYLALSIDDVRDYLA